MYLRHDDKDDRDDRSEAARGCGERLRESALPNARRLFFLALVKVVQREDALLRWLGLLRRCLGRGPERHEIERASERASGLDLLFHVPRSAGGVPVFSETFSASVPGAERA